MRTLRKRAGLVASIALVACGAGEEASTTRPTGPAYSQPSGPGSGGGAGGTTGASGTSGAGGATQTVPGGLVCGVDGCQPAAGAAGAPPAGGSAGASTAGNGGSSSGNAGAPLGGKGGASGGAAGAPTGGAPAAGAPNGGSGGSIDPAGGAAGAAGAAGSILAGAGGASQGGAAGLGGATVAGAAGSPQGGAAGSPQGGAAGLGGAIVAGSAGVGVGGAAGSPQGGAAGLGGAIVAGAGGVIGGGGAAGTASGYPAPLAYWPLDVVRGVAAAEQVTARGAMLLDVTATSGLSGGAMHIGAIDSYMWLPTTAWEQPLTELTISMWVRPDDDWTGFFGHDLLRRGGTVLSRWADEVRFAVGQDTVFVKHQLTQGAWYHIVATYSSGVELTISVEDATIPGASTSTVQPAVGSIGATGPVSVFRVPGGAFHGGALDDLAIFDRALTVSERAELYARGTSGLSPLCPSCAPALTPLHAWRFDEPSYDRATPELVLGLPSVTVGLSDQAAGVVGDGLHAPEVLASGITYQPGSGVIVPPEPALHGATLTLAAWVRPDRALTPTDVGMAWFASDDVLPNRGFWFGYDQGVTLTLGDGKTGNMPRHTQVIPLSGGDWHHVAATYDGVDTALYVDGQLAGTSSLAIAYAPGAAALQLCGNPASAIGRPVFPGVCDEVAIFASALSAGEIQSLYARGVAGLPLK